MNFGRYELNKQHARAYHWCGGTHLALVTGVYGVGLVTIIAREDVDKVAVHARHQGVELEQVEQRVLAALAASLHVSACAAVQRGGGRALAAGAQPQLTEPAGACTGPQRAQMRHVAPPQHIGRAAAAAARRAPALSLAARSLLFQVARAQPGVEARERTHGQARGRHQQQQQQRRRSHGGGGAASGGRPAGRGAASYRIAHGDLLSRPGPRGRRAVWARRHVALSPLD